MKYIYILLIYTKCIESMRVNEIYIYIYIFYQSDYLVFPPSTIVNDIKNYPYNYGQLSIE